MIEAIDLFAGCGGMTEAARIADVRVIWAGNHSPDAVKWHARNHPDVEHVCQDLRQADFSRLPNVGAVLAGPACQGHSTASQPRRGVKHDADRSTAWAVVDCAEAKRPAVLVVENVTRMFHWVLFPAWRMALEALGYTLSILRLNAADYDTPQDRERIFVIGRLDGRLVMTPPLGRRNPFRPCLITASRGWTRVDSKSLDVRCRVEAGRRNVGVSTFLTQHVTGHPGRSLDRPIGTITCASGHWCLVDGAWMRTLTPRELARGQGFRDDFEIPNEATLAGRLIGNAVPVPLGTAVIRAAIEGVA